MLNGRKIEKLIYDSGHSKSEVYNQIGISRATLYNILEGKGSPSCENVEKLADFFKVPIDSFFDRSVDITNNIGHQVNGNGNKVSGNISLNECRKEIEHLNSLLTRKDELLAEKERTIQILLNQQPK